MSSGPHPSGDSTDSHLQVQNHHDWVARDCLVLGSDESVHKTSSKTFLGGKSVDSTIQQQTSQQSSLLEYSMFGIWKSGMKIMVDPQRKW